MARIAQLDVLRAIAVLLVVGSHLTWNPMLSRFGWTGVDLFFVLSGYLVSGLLFREYKASGSIQWKRFVIRRGFKIYPAYYTLIVVTVALYRFIDNPAWTPVRWDLLWSDLVFVQDYRMGTWGHLWSLGIEEQFYLLLPLCLWLMARRPTPKELTHDKPDAFARMPWVCWFVMAACLILRAFTYYRVIPFNHYSHMRPIHLRADALFFGVLLSWLSEFRPDATRRFLDRNYPLLLAVSFVCLVPALVLEQQSAFLYIPGLTALYAGYGGILLCSVRRPIPDGFPLQLMSGIGRASYSVYLWHLPIAFFSVSVLQNNLHWGRNAVFAAYVVISLLAGVILARAIEYPALKLRERWFPGLNVRPAAIPPDRGQVVRVERSLVPLTADTGGHAGS